MTDTFPARAQHRQPGATRPAPASTAGPAGRDGRMAVLAGALGVPAALGPVTYAIVGAEAALQPPDTAAVRVVVDRIVSDRRAWELVVQGRGPGVRDELVAAIPADDLTWTRATHLVTAVLETIRACARRRTGG